ncbi:MAG: DUF488 domain-containing protein [Caulobacterales bacterium]|nr:DUF488 domain-containing protein [Caulobacterales bacterium]
MRGPDEARSGRPPRLATIGYERATQPDVIARLIAAGVELVIDVREVASSRRAGFSKRVLAASLDEAGLAYVHLRALGTPKPGRIASRAGRTDEMRAIYETRLAEPDAQAALAEACELARERPSALLCYEADAQGCHRRIVAERLRDAAGFEVVDL